ncbi:methyltransferase domain-containing protein [Marinobacter sp. TBZ242]|uniref:Methyltransferase domain-containing protein n=1 Tax=Marinobacter azerbaijanicus TaxID=3050455 RepID=A0ABT7IGC3_9GAMM|nr:methyltransferase domain-containing protein [Marinobacter sp. TBZ242]MDL0432735.1 methyltransferase domain-containing protein [Marinobacter sp. TBZ242]
MSVHAFDALACPLDGDALSLSQACWRCPSGHSFDVARQGYLHLLPVQNKRSLDPGDSKAMVAARQRFLNAGYYQPVAEAVNTAVLHDMPSQTISLACLDAGCGEGYYLRQLAAAESGVPLSLMGLDISKWATLAAAKQDKRPRWVVGSNANIPVLPGTLDRLLCLFGFPAYAEFARVLKPGGILVQADAGPDHLRELREVIYPSLKPGKPAATEAPHGFSTLDTETVRYPLTLDSQASIADLLAMTPHLYRASAEGRARAEALETLTVTVEVTLRRFANQAGATLTAT